MGNVTSLKDIFAIERSQVYPNLPEYVGKNMRHYNAYKRTVEYTLGECLFTCCTNKEKCIYIRQFLTEIFVEHWKTMKTQIKESPTLEFDYETFMEMLKERLLSWKIHQIKVRTKLKFLC